MKSKKAVANLILRQLFLYYLADFPSLIVRLSFAYCSLILRLLFAHRSVIVRLSFGESKGKLT